MLFITKRINCKRNQVKTVADDSGCTCTLLFTRYRLANHLGTLSEVRSSERQFERRASNGIIGISGMGERRISGWMEC